jgi:myosin heavy subunit
LQAAAGAADKARWGLTRLEDFAYTNQSGTFVRNDVTDANQHVRCAHALACSHPAAADVCSRTPPLTLTLLQAETLRAMDTCGLSAAEREFCFATVMAVLHLGNVTFKPAAQKVAGKNEITEGSAVEEQGKSGASLQAAAKLLDVDAAELMEALTEKRVNVGFGANTFASGCV